MATVFHFKFAFFTWRPLLTPKNFIKNKIKSMKNLNSRETIFFFETQEN